jgi:RHS repeat-associated core domain
VVKYGHDAASNRTGMTDPQNGVTAYVYDALNRISTLTNPSAQKFTYGYDVLSRRTSLARPNSVTSTYAYDSASNLLSVLHKKANTLLDGATYTYDGVGSRKTRQDNRTNVTSTFTYDPVYELTLVKQGTTTTENYSYDAVGNRLSSVGVNPYVYNSSNELNSTPSTTYSYDNNGNTLNKTAGANVTGYTWDFDNRLTQVTLPGSGGSVTFKYDPMGRRIQKSSSAGTTNYVYDGQNILEEVSTTGTVVARYTQGLGIDQPLAIARGGVTSYYHADGLGSITSLTNSSGAIANTYTYDSFGNQTASTGTVVNPFRFTGRELDSETGNYFYRARYYDQSTGRFLSEDGQQFSSGVDFYSYVKNSPIRFSDPMGLDIWIEGPSGAEPLGHMSINVGDPNGDYSSYGFGVNSELPGFFPGEVYQDTSHGGDFVPGYYLKTTAAQDAIAKAHLDSLLGSRAGYRPWRTCRNFSQDQFKNFQKQGIGAPAPPPARAHRADAKSYVPGVTGSTASDKENGKNWLLNIIENTPSPVH